MEIQAEVKRGVVGITKRRTRKEKKIWRHHIYICTTSILEEEKIGNKNKWILLKDVKTLLGGDAKSNYLVKC